MVKEGIKSKLENSMTPMKTKLQHNKNYRMELKQCFREIYNCIYLFFFKEDVKLTNEIWKHWKTLEKKEKAKPKTNRSKEIIKIKMEINETENQ